MARGAVRLKSREGWGEESPRVNSERKQWVTAIPLREVGVTLKAPNGAHLDQQFLPASLLGS